MSQPNVPAADKSAAARSVFFLAELPYHELLRKRDPQKASKLEARMQQILGEAVYLNDGRVIDSIGPRMIAIMPSSAKAIEAARRSQAELLEYNSSQPPQGDVVEPPLVVHSGQQVTDGSAFSSATVNQGLQILRSMQPLQLLVSEPALREAGKPIPRTAVGEVSGVKFYEPAPEAASPVLPIAPSPARPLTPGPSPRRGEGRKLAWLGGIAALAIIVAVAALLLTRKQEEPAPVPTAAPAPEPAAPAVPPPIQKITVSLAMTEPRMSRVEQITRAVLSRHPRIEIVPADGAVAVALSAVPAKARTVNVTVGSAPATPVSVNPPWAAAAQILGLIADAAELPRSQLTSSRPGVMQKFAEAARTRNSRLLQAAIEADPAFEPALRLGLDLFGSDLDRKRAIQTTDRLLAIHPDDLTTRKKAVAWLVGSGRSAEAIPHLDFLLKTNPRDAEALLTVARLSLSAFDQARFREAARRHQAATGMRIFHDADLDLVQGQIDKAVRVYYEAERADPNNAALALKIGKVAVLRHSMPMANLELEKLRGLDPDYGFHLLRAYISAEKRAAQEAERFLALAQLGATAKDDPFTSSAEVYAILSQHSKVMESLKAAAARGEATLTYVLTNPLLRYLDVEADFQALKGQLEQQRNELRAGLQKLQL